MSDKISFIQSKHVYGLGWTEDDKGEPYQVTCKLSSPGTGYFAIYGELSDEAAEAVKFVMDYASITLDMEVLSSVNITILLPEGIDGASFMLPLYLCMYGLLNDLDFHEDLYCTGCFGPDGDVMSVEEIHDKVNVVENGRIILPYDNWEDVEMKSGVYFHPVQNIEEAIEVAFKNNDILLETSPTLH